MADVRCHRPIFGACAAVHTTRYTINSGYTAIENQYDIWVGFLKFSFFFTIM